MGAEGEREKRQDRQRCRDRETEAKALNHEESDKETRSHDPGEIFPLVSGKELSSSMWVPRCECEPFWLHDPVRVRPSRTLATKRPYGL